MERRSLLAVFAHPDDESFSVGGTLARYAAEGVHVTLVCATRGEVGGIADPSLATPETLGQVREAELRCAAEALGISEVIFLGYRDSGMAGSPENEDPHAFINAPADEVEARLVEIVRRVQPQVVITFEPGGGYGHPDHIAAHRHTVAAFHAAGDPARYPDYGAPWRPARLFYTAIPRSFFVEMRRRLEELGVDTGEFDRFEQRAVLGWPDEEVHVVVDVSATIEAKWKALNCHRTQFGPDNFFRRLPEPMLKEMMSREHFALARPEPTPGLRLDDLFADLPIPMDEHRFRSGSTWSEYVAQMSVNRRRVTRLYGEITIAPEDRRAFRDAVARHGGRLYVTAMTEDWCGDAVVNLPLMARLAAEVPGMELRLFRRSENPDLEQRYAANGIFSIPALSFFDAKWREVARWVERPAAARERIEAWWAARPEAAALRHSKRPEDQEARRVVLRELLGEMMRWYRDGLWQATLEEWKAVL